MNNVILADKFVKINVHPYFYEVFFEQPICVEQSSCKILESNVKFCLKKERDEWWSSLGKTSKSATNSNETIACEEKREIFGEYEKSVQENQKLNQKERSKLKRNEIEKEIERETQIRKKIENTESTLNSLQISEVC